MSINDHSEHWHMPAAYLKLFLKHAILERRNIEELLEGTGLQPDELHGGDQVVSFAATRRVLSNVSGLLGPAWHLTLASQLTVPAHGPLGFAAVTAPDLRASVGVLLRFFGIRGPFLRLAGAIEEEEFIIRFYESTSLGDERNALVELALLAVQALLERSLGRELQGACIALAYPAPVYREQLEDVFHPRLQFSAKRHALSFPAKWLNEPCALYDEAMHRYLVTRCEDELRLAFGILPAEIAVRQALLSRPAELPGLAEIAAQQHISPRTLIRRLKRGNTSYQAILEDVRKTMAVDYLLHSRMSMASIAYRLGYQDPSNFGRAFRSWFGESPGSYRSRTSH